MLFDGLQVNFLNLVHNHSFLVSHFSFFRTTILHRVGNRMFTSAHLIRLHFGETESSLCPWVVDFCSSFL